jgi:hypothetical protein
MPQDFTVTLTDEQAEALRQLADHWRETIDGALRRVVTTGIDIAMMEKENDEEQTADQSPEALAKGDLDDGIPF